MLQLSNSEMGGGQGTEVRINRLILGLHEIAYHQEIEENLLKINLHESLPIIHWDFDENHMKPLFLAIEV